MDYYQLLRVGANASRKEIDEAYQKLLKESRYDTTIDRTQVETAYRILTDIASRTHYDARQTMRNKRTVRLQKKRLPRIGIIEWIKQRTLPQLLITLAVVLCIAIVFYAIRYGYMLQEFQAGDVLYEKISHLQFGKIIRVEENHSFGSKSIDAYQVELNPAMRRYGAAASVLWLPQDSVKARCYKKKK